MSFRGLLYLFGTAYNLRDFRPSCLLEATILRDYTYGLMAIQKVFRETTHLPPFLPEEVAYPRESLQEDYLLPPMVQIPVNDKRPL